MTKSELYDNIISSIIKMTTDFISAEYPQATYCDFDAHSSLTELPDGVLIGPAGCGMSIEEKGISVVFAIGVATNNDPNLFVLRGLISKLVGLVYPQTRITIYDHDTARAASWMVTKAPQAVTPVSKAELRSLQFVEIHALIDLSATSIF